MTEEVFFAGIDEAREQIKRGEGITFTNAEEMNSWLNSLQFFENVVHIDVLSKWGHYEDK